MDNPTFDQLVKTADLADIRPTGPHEDSWNTILDNQLKFNSRDSYNIAKELLPRLEPLWNIVAVQPMEGGPVGTCYYLRYKQYESEEFEGTRMSLEVMAQPYEAGARKLRSTMDIEQQEYEHDDKAVKKISQEIANEITSEWVDKIEHFAFENGEFQTLPRHYEDKMTSPQILSCAINQHASDIARITRRGAGNFVILNQVAFNVIKETNTAIDLNETPIDEDVALQEMGTLNGTIKVFIDNTDTSEQGKALVGYKGGATQTDASLFWHPFLPVLMNGPVMNPLTFQPLMSFMTRYGKTILESAVNYHSGFTFIDRT